MGTAFPDLLFRVPIRGTVLFRPTWLVIVIGGPPARFWPGVIGHWRVRHQPKLNVVSFLRSSGTSEFLYVEP